MILYFHWKGDQPADNITFRKTFCNRWLLYLVSLSFDASIEDKLWFIFFSHWQTNSYDSSENNFYLSIYVFSNSLHAYIYIYTLLQDTLETKFKIHLNLSLIVNFVISIDLQVLWMKWEQLKPSKFCMVL